MKFQRRACRVLRSRAFARSQRARDLLLYSVSSLHDGGTTRLKESVIALDASAGTPPPTIQPTMASSVFLVNRLRELLDRYYGDEGAATVCESKSSAVGMCPSSAATRLPGCLPSRALPSCRWRILPDGATRTPLRWPVRRHHRRHDAVARCARDARTSSFRYKNANRDVREIATELAVDALLEGSGSLTAHNRK